MENYDIELLRIPSESDWMWVKTCALNTVGKTPFYYPDQDWKHKILAAGHSPIRELVFGIKMTIPSWVSVHFVRHHIGVNHYVQSQRDDRSNSTATPRSQKPQGELVTHIMSVNAQELIFMSHKRLCAQASPETRQVMRQICDLVIARCPEFAGLLQPECEYRNGICSELKPCGKCPTKEN